MERESNLPVVNKDRQGRVEKILASIGIAAHEVTVVATGIASQTANETLASAGRVLQAMTQWQLLEGLSKELSKLKECGAVKPEALASPKHLDNVQALLKAVEENPSDSERLRLLKRILIASAIQGNDSSDPMPSEYMNIARTLSGGEILVMFGAFRWVRKTGTRALNNERIDNWINTVSELSKMQNEVVQKHTFTLVEKRLMKNNAEHLGASVDCGIYYNLTNLGFMLCEFVERYDHVRH